MLKELTPSHLRCASVSCVAVYAIDGGDLVVVGKRPSPEVARQIHAKVGEDEYAVVIHSDYFRDLPDSQASST